MPGPHPESAAHSKHSLQGTLYTASWTGERDTGSVRPPTLPCLESLDYAKPTTDRCNYL